MMAELELESERLTKEIFEMEYKINYPIVYQQLADKIHTIEENIMVQR